MRRATLIAAFAVGMAVVSACADGKQSSSNTGPERSSLPSPGGNANNATASTEATNAANLSNANTATMQDDFWTAAARGSMTEIEMSKVAQTKATNSEVKKFAQMVVADHTKASSELKALAAKQNRTLPTTLSAGVQDDLQDLQGLSGAEFDRTYVDAMVEAHEADVQLFEDQAQDNDAAMAEVKAWAAKTLPTLQKHLEMIKGIQSRLQ